jgi:CheY-like chemotaxis protein
VSCSYAPLSSADRPDGGGSLHHGRLRATLNNGPGAAFSFPIPCRPEGLADAETPANRTDLSADAAYSELGNHGVGRSNTKVQWTALIRWRIVSVVEIPKARGGSDRPLLSVVDDDESVRESLPDLLREFGFAARAFSSAEEFLSSDCLDQTSCLILDIAMPGIGGPELQRELKRRGQEIPVIFITASTDKAVRPRQLEQGAVECLFKPFSDTALLEALNAALRVN